MPGTPKPITIRGVTYMSRAIAADALGITVNAIAAAIKRGNLDGVGMQRRKSGPKEKEFASLEPLPLIERSGYKSVPDLDPATAVAVSEQYHNVAATRKRAARWAKLGLGPKDIFRDGMPAQTVTPVQDWW